jgi:hypothetical protein
MVAPPHGVLKMQAADDDQKRAAAATLRRNAAFGYVESGREQKKSKSF